MGLLGSIRKAERKVQKQRRLQRRYYDVRPVDDRVQRVHLAGELERVQNERDQAKDIKVGRFRGRPAPEEHVKPDQQIHHGDQPQSQIDRPISRFQDDRNIQVAGVGRIAARAARQWPLDRIVRMRPDAVVEHLANLLRQRCRGMFVYGEQYVAFTNSGALPRNSGGNLLRAQSAGGFGPGDPVRRNVEARLRRQIQTREHARSHSHCGEHDSENPRLEDVPHERQPNCFKSLHCYKWRCMHVDDQTVVTGVC